MSSGLSIDLRQRVVYAVGTGASQHQAAERIGAGRASPGRACEQFALKGTSRPSRWAAISTGTGSKLMPA